MRIALILEYDGTHFHGWQQQNSKLRTVQAVVEEALSKIADEPIQVICAGRTDTGVHAHNQVIHFDTSAKRDSYAWQIGTNTYLPDDVAVKSVHFVEDDFHARYSAIQRTYRYIICNQKYKPALGRDYMTWETRPLNEKLMHKAAQGLIGEHDFSSFRSSECQSKTPFRCIDEISVTRENDKVITVIKANAFLHHMVRNIMGVLITVGVGKQPVSWVKKVLDAKDRTVANVTAPANGLFLESVLYPKEYL